MERREIRKGEERDMRMEGREMGRKVKRERRMERKKRLMSSLNYSSIFI